MRILPFAAAIAGGLAFAPALAAPTVSGILAANEAATAPDSAWTGKKTLELKFDYAGQGLTGTTYQLEDLITGASLSTYQIGPTSGATGFDGTNAWEREQSGTVTDQKGGDVLPLAYSGAYQNENAWWRKDRGGATIRYDGRKTADGATYDVLTVSPPNGTPFDAWFDTKTHLVSRIVQVQGTLTIAVMFSDYASYDGVMLAKKQVVDDGTGAQNYQTLTLTSAKFLPEQPPSAYARPAQNLNDYSIAGGASQTTVPFALINNHIYAHVSVNGSKPLLFIFDTGGHDILTPPTAGALGIKPLGAQTSTGAGDSTATSGVATVQSIRVGDAVLTGQPVSVLQFDNPAEGVDEQGMIGYEFFDRFITRFDYGNHTITFIDKTAFDPRDAGTPVPIRLYHQFPEVLGSFDGIPGRFGIDTGARTALSLTGPFAAKNNIRARVSRGAVALTGWGVGGPSRGFVFRGGTLKLDSVTIENPLTEIGLDKGGAMAAEAFPNNVGGGILKRFVVTLDYDHNLMYLKPLEGAVPDLDTFDRAGMWINVDNGGFTIVDVTKGGPADESGLAKGDVITAVNGTPVANLKLYDVRQMLRDDAPGTVVTFSVKAGGAMKDVKVTLRDLI